MTKIGSLVVSYNKMISNLSEEGGKTNKAYLKSLFSTLENASGQLKKIGITVKSDGTLETDYATLCDADVADSSKKRLEADLLWHRHLQRRSER